VQDHEAGGEPNAIDAEALYDRYLDASLVGDPEDPAEFFARHPHIETQARERIEALHGVLTGAGPREGDDGKPPFETVGEYRLLRTIARGGMGSIYLAEQQSSHRLVALKLLRPELTTSRSAVRRFEREAMVIQRLDHPHVVKMLEVGEENGAQFIAMELIAGRSLRSVLPRGRPAIARTLAWMEQSARALHAAHEEGIIHRDVKPANIVITPDDRAVLLDFGVAHLAGAEHTRLTQTFAGSPSYAAPEQVDPALGEVDARTDVYGLGATLYESITQRVPFEGKSLDEVFQKVLRREPVAPRRLHAGLPRDIETITLKALAKRPGERYQSALELADDLRAARLGERIRAKPPGPVARLRRLARRNPARATAVVTVTFAILLAFGFTIWHVHEERESRRREASAAFEQALRKLDLYRANRQEDRELRDRYLDLRDRTQDSYLSDERHDEFEVVTLEMDKIHHRREALIHATLELLRRAERLDPQIDGTDSARAQLYVEQMEESFEAQDLRAAAFFRELVAKHDPTGALTRPNRRSAKLTLETDPPGATAYVFRDLELHELGGSRERRYIPIPVGVDPAELPDWFVRGDWALRVVADCGELRRGDLIFQLNGHRIKHTVMLREPFRGLPAGSRLLDLRGLAAVEELKPGVEHALRIGSRTVKCRASELPVASPAQLAERGGLPARVRRGDEVIELEQLPEGLSVRTTAVPLLWGAANRRQTPFVIDLEPGDYRILLHHPERQETRTTVRLTPGARTMETTRMPPVGEGRPGFVYVPSPAPFWIMEHEVTCAEYVEFVRATSHGSDWPHDDSGSARVPDDWNPQWPALGISFDDALAYARWKGAGYALPTHLEWIGAAQGRSLRKYVFGNEWRPRWAKSCFSRPRALPEPVMRYPIDESAYGVYDLTGSAAEWMDAWWDQPRGLRRLGGSAWAFADPSLFKIWGGDGATPDSRGHTFGFRLVWRKQE